MTARTNARVAGFAFLLYIAAGVTNMVLAGRARGTGDVAAKLASIAAHATLMRLSILLTLVEVVCALVLGVTLWALTRDEDADLAMLGLSFRLAEGVVGAVATLRAASLLSIATALPGATGAGSAASIALGGALLGLGGWAGLASASCFAAGSTIFSWLFLRAGTIPHPLAWLGIAASAPMVILLPGQLAGFVSGPLVNYMWLPMLVFELTLAGWLLVKGVGPVRRAATST